MQVLFLSLDEHSALPLSLLEKCLNLSGTVHTFSAAKAYDAELRSEIPRTNCAPESGHFEAAEREEGSCLLLTEMSCV
jgi:hypothetical protein